MHSETTVVVGADRPTAGPVSLVQGIYGARGNLELIACDRADGLWVFWYNSDLASDPLETPDVPPGAWSAGLKFAAGHRYVSAQILQSSLGPNHLEVLALDTDGVLQSWYWSPGPGFQRRAVDAAVEVAAFAADHVEGTLHVSSVGSDGTVRHLVSPPVGYPERSWLSAAAGPDLADASATELPTSVDPGSVAPGSVRRASSSRHGGTTEFTWRDTEGLIRHLPIPR